MVVIGHNSADDAEIARKFVTENEATYPTILDTSLEGYQAMAQYETLGMSAVPMTYLINPEGKVVDAWYGHNPAQMEKYAELIQQWLEFEKDK